MSRPQKRSFNRPQKQTGQRGRVKKKLAPGKTLSGISAFQDAQGKVVTWPSDRRLDAQTAVLEHLAVFFEGGRTYSAAEVQGVLKERSTLDHATLLGELMDRDYLRHDPAAGSYWRSIGRPTALPPEPTHPEATDPEPNDPEPADG